MDSRQTTRLSSRSVFRRDIGTPLPALSPPTFSPTGAGAGAYSPPRFRRARAAASWPRQPTPARASGARGYAAGVITWRNGTVSRRAAGMAGGAGARGDGQRRGREAPAQVRALAYPALTGRPEPGDRVLLNTTALDLGLGTGGYALVVAVPDRLPPDRSGPGHLVKARYTPLQAVVLGADEQGSPYHECCAPPTTSPGCRWWWPTCIPLSRPSWLASIRRRTGRRVTALPAGRRPAGPETASTGRAGRAAVHLLPGERDKDPAGRGARGVCDDRRRARCRRGSPGPAPRCGRPAGWPGRSPWARRSAATWRR